MSRNNIEKVIVIGCGGTGSILLPSLTRYLLSIEFKGRLILADGDSYSDSNLTRQLFNARMVGTNKAEYQAQVISSQIPQLLDQIEYLDKFLTKEDIDSLIEENTVVINCVDNKAARKYVEDRVSSLDNAAHICCGNELVTGQVQLHYRKGGESITPSIYQQSPKFNSDNDDRSTLSCEELSNLPGGGQLICANMMAASIALNYFMQITSNNIIFNNNGWVSCGTVAFDCNTNAFAQEDTIPFVFRRDPCLTS